MASVSSLSFSRNNEAKTFETKSGSYIYAGEAHTFHEWEFRTLLKARSNAAATPLPRSEETGEADAEGQADEAASEHPSAAASEHARSQHNTSHQSANHLAKDAQKVVEGL